MRKNLWVIYEKQVHELLDSSLETDVAFAAGRIDGVGQLNFDLDDCFFSEREALVACASRHYADAAACKEKADECMARVREISCRRNNGGA